MQSWRSPIYGALLAAVLAGCAAPVSTNIKVSEANVAKFNDLSELSVVATLEKNVEEARKSGMPLLAPNYFREAEQTLKECQGGLGNKPKEVLVSGAAMGDALLEKGRAVMGIVQYRFAKELEYKAQLDEHNAAKLLPKEYDRVIGELSGLIEKVEREQPDNIDAKKEGLQKSMLDLVIKAVQEGALRESETINVETESDNAERQAPLTYAEALRVYQSAKDQIAAAHHDMALVQRLGAEALFAAHHAQQVNERVALLQTQLRVNSSGSLSSGVAVSTGATTQAQAGVQIENKPAAMDKVSVEMIVLQEEDRLLGIAKALGLKDLRDLSLDKQVAEIRRAAESVRHTGSGIAAAPVQDFEARLKAANEGIQQMGSELNAKDQQLAEKDRLLAEQAQKLDLQAALMEGKDAQIKTLKDKVDKLEWEKPAKPIPKRLKPTAAGKTKEAVATKK
ncbi:MAG: hypothetical protein A2100_04145 [Sideroxydans sp. GWF2_59_14]|nr:MAG: hypothetical protein A2100_04145 [Sideroxydans sp. GWF2_59_14]HAF45493.1 hypothetical protein [Gallionellaceae bacterium]